MEHLTSSPDINTPRWSKSNTSVYNTVIIHKRNPYIMAWWSAAFPGFGHMLLGKLLRGLILFSWEIIVNTKSNLNIAMVYSFTGQVDKATEVLNQRWILLYIPVYIFAIWDSYRTTISLNRIAQLSQYNQKPFHLNSIEMINVNKIKPKSAIVWSLFFPGLGQLLNQQLVSSIFIMTWTSIIFYKSRLLEAIYYLVLSHFHNSLSVLNEEWLLFLPSIYGFGVFQSYMTSVELNKLYELDLRTFLRLNYPIINSPINQRRRK